MSETRSSPGMAMNGGSSRALSNWLPTVGWALRRTGKAGLVGIAMVAAALIFLVSTHLPLRSEVDSLRADFEAAKLASVRHAAQATAALADDPGQLLSSLPERLAVPKLLAVILQQADEAGLSLDSGKYDVSSQRVGGVTRYNISLPVTGAYPAIRTFIDSVLKVIPTVSISELSIERKNIADGVVEANVRLTLYTRGAP